jgi:hypothetical protein
VHARLTAVVLFPSFIRGTLGEKTAIASVEFAPLLLASPLDLKDARSLEISFDPLWERCTASLSSV